MKAGYGQADITPARPMPLCGFAARCGEDSHGVDDPLFVRALAVESDGATVIVLSFDLLALGPAAARIRTALEAQAPAAHCILCCTHTHSAPAAIELLGCGALQPDYVASLVPAACSAAAMAVSSMRPARLRWAARDIADQTHNRRSVLADGRVSMARRPDGTVVRRGPVWTRFLLARIDDESGRGIAGIASWAAHPDTVAGPNVSADFPGELCRRLEETHGFPFLFLQGPCANINPFFEQMTRGEMLANVDALMPAVDAIHWPAPPATAPRMHFRRRTIPLAYAAPMPARELRALSAGMRTMAGTGDGPPAVLRVLGDILNVPSGQRPEPRMARHMAGTLADWAGRVLETTSASPLRPAPLEAAVWRLDDLAFCFVAAEPFAETGLAIQGAAPGIAVVPVGYSSPLVGYLPTDEALREGGYEAAYAYRFYGHSAPFAPGSEPGVVRAIVDMIRETA